jgi:hypothetical protein
MFFEVFFRVFWVECSRKDFRVFQKNPFLFWNYEGIKLGNIRKLCKTKQKTLQIAKSLLIFKHIRAQSFGITQFLDNCQFYIKNKRKTQGNLGKKTLNKFDSKYFFSGI